MYKTNHFIPIVLLIGVTAVWGWTFVVVRDAVAAYPVMPFLFLRFLIAVALLVPGNLFTRGRGISVGILPGIVLGLGYICQTFGLQHTSASRAGLLTGLCVVFTPLLEFAVRGRRPGAGAMAATVGCFIGTALLTTSGGGWAPTHDELLGDGLEIATGFLFALHIVILGQVAPRHDASRLVLGQMLACVALFGVGSVPSGLPHLTPAIVMALAITGMVATAVAFWIQTFVQGLVSPARTAVVMVMEPAFATLFGVLLAGDIFSRAQALGAGLILLCLIAHESAPLWRRVEQFQSASI